MVMIYFSGTGNSKCISKLFCKYMDTKCYSIEENIDFSKLIKSEEVLGFCYPIYGSRVPRIMREFVTKYIELCISICPMKNLEYENGHIIHKNNCTICYRCINKCPQKAIALFFKNKVKRQYIGINTKNE